MGEHPAGDGRRRSSKSDGIGSDWSTMGDHETRGSRIRMADNYPQATWASRAGELFVIQEKVGQSWLMMVFVALALVLTSKVESECGRPTSVVGDSISHSDSDSDGDQCLW